jgi:hypothetical protein
VKHFKDENFHGASIQISIDVKLKTVQTYYISYIDKNAVKQIDFTSQKQPNILIFPLHLTCFEGGIFISVRGKKHTILVGNYS